MAWFTKTHVPRAAPQKRARMEGLWVKCDDCGQVVYRDEWARGLEVCPKCGFHAPLTARRRLEVTLDPGSFEEVDAVVEPADPLGFADSKKYPDRLRQAQVETGEREALVTGVGAIEGVRTACGAFSFGFLGGSMGSVVGEKVARLFERAAAERLPVVLFSASGGARMQEGVLSLMQMAKTACTLARYRQARKPYISVMLHPTTGGVAASFAWLGDLIFAEPKALIGFAGPRVIEQTIRQKLPEGFQRAEFLLEHGMIDAVVTRKEMRGRLAQALSLLG